MLCSAQTDLIQRLCGFSLLFCISNFFLVSIRLVLFILVLCIYTVIVIISFNCYVFISILV